MKYFTQIKLYSTTFHSTRHVQILSGRLKNTPSKSALTRKSPHPSISKCDINIFRETERRSGEIPPLCSNFSKQERRCACRGKSETRSVSWFTHAGLRSFDDATDGERRRRLLSADFAANREKNKPRWVSEPQHCANVGRCSGGWGGAKPHHVPEHSVFERRLCGGSILG